MTSDRSPARRFTSVRAAVLAGALIVGSAFDAASTPLLRVDLAGSGSSAVTSVTLTVLFVPAFVPLSPVVNFGFGQTVTNAYTVLVVRCVYSSQSTDVIADVLGFYPGGSTSRSRTPAGLTDVGRCSPLRLLGGMRGQSLVADFWGDFPLAV